MATIKKFNEWVNEERQPSDNLKYTEKRSKAGELKSVKLEMSSKVSEIATKLAKKIYEIKDEIEKLQNEQKKLTDDAKEYCLGFFDASDEVVTKYLETVSWVFTLTAKTLEDEDKTEVDQEAITKKINEVIETQFPKLKEIINDITKEFTIVKKATMEVKTPVRLKSIEKKNESEEINEGIIDKVKDFIKNIYNKFKSSFDKKIDDFDKSMNKYKSELKSLI